MTNRNPEVDLESSSSPQRLAEVPGAPLQPLHINRRAIFPSTLGTVVEYYDFAIYGYMATFISALFFSAGDSSAALLGTFATFAVAFFLRIPGDTLRSHR